jgi:hypothetical protein
MGNIELGTTLLFKGHIDDQRYIRIYRVYDGHFIWYDEMPTEGGTSREVKILNKKDMDISFNMLIEEGLISEEQVNDFLKDIRV